MKAVIIEDVGRSGVKEIPELTLRPGYIKVKTVAVAINSTDFHHTAGAGPIGGILGCDFSGVVEEVDKDCKSSVKKGDKVYGACHCANSNNPLSGSFAEIVLVREGHLAKIPEHLSFEETATLGVGITSVGQSLYMTLKLPLPIEPTNHPFWILIYGGSGATGSLAIQFAKLSGLKVVTTASPNNFEFVKSLGADAVFDYHDPDCARNIRECTHNSLQYILDTISVESSFKICADSFPAQAEEGVELMLVTLLPADEFPRKDVNVQVVLAYTTFGEAFSKFGTDFPAIEEHYKFGVMFWKMAGELLAEGKFKPHPAIIMEGGLQGVPAGIAKVSHGTISAAKLVYRVAETPDSPSTKSNDDHELRGPVIHSW